MSPSAIFLIPIAILIGALLIRRQPSRVPYHEPVYRLHPGVAHKAEWMASPTVVQQVTTDYRAALTWATEALVTDYARYLHELPQYYSGEGLSAQSRIVLTHVRRSGTRLVGVLEAEHIIEVRRFSSSGLTCDLFDRQSAQRMITIDLWTKHRVTVQSLGSALYVYRMQYDPAAKRWKIAGRAQQLPVGCNLTHMPSAAIQLTDQLPVATGHD